MYMVHVCGAYNSRYLHRSYFNQRMCESSNVCVNPPTIPWRTNEVVTEQFYSTKYSTQYLSSVCDKQAKHNNIKKRKFKTVMIINSTNINKMNNHISFKLNSLNTKMTMTSDVENPVPGLGQAQRSSGACI